MLNLEEFKQLFREQEEGADELKKEMQRLRLERERAKAEGDKIRLERLRQQNEAAAEKQRKLAKNNIITYMASLIALIGGLIVQLILVILICC